MKPWAYVVLILLLVGAIGGVYSKGHSAGYDKRDKTVQQEIDNAVSKAQETHEAEKKAAVDAALAEIEIEERIVEVIREVEVEIPTVVERIVEVKPECRDLGDDYGRLLDEQVRAANSESSSDNPGPLDDGVPGTEGL